MIVFEAFVQGLRSLALFVGGTIFGTLIVAFFSALIVGPIWIFIHAPLWLLLIVPIYVIGIGFWSMADDYKHSEWRKGRR